jgi:CRP/FNR family transcriptional regulator
MQIDLDLLFSWGAIAKEYKKNEVIFVEDDANFYYQIIEGCVRMFNSNDDGKEFTQGYFAMAKVLENLLVYRRKISINSRGISGF